MGTLNRLASLVDKNLLRQIEQDDVEPRFVMLETIREYAIEQLTASEEEEAIRHAHADYYVALAEEVEPKLTTAEQGAWLERLETEHDNLRSAFSWALKRGETEVALRLGGSLWRFWYMWGYMSEGRRWLEAALVLSGAGATLLRAKALGGAGHLAWGQGDLDRAAVLHEEGLELYRQSGDKAGIATALNGLSFVSRMRRDYTKARAMCEEALAIHRELDDRWGIAQSLFLLGAVAAYQGDHVAARPPLEESVALFQETGDREGLADALGVLGMTALSRGDLAAARSLAGESRTIFESIGDRRGVAKTLTVMGDIFLEEGELEAARARHEEGLEILRDLDDRWGMAWCLEGLAGVTASQGQPARAARIFGAAEALREAIEGPRPPVRQAIYKREVAAARAGLDDKAFAAAWAEGRAMAPEQALATEEQTSASGLPDEPPELTRLASTPTYPAGLTSREVEVLRLVAQGLTNAQVGEGLFISPRTVDTHLTSIYQKLGVSSRSAATRYAVDHNLT
jgi:DNA-binding CsgD family transcriptional regulator/tetratricopeptide (TPR) repeat protein